MKTTNRKKGTGWLVLAILLTLALAAELFLHFFPGEEVPTQQALSAAAQGRGFASSADGSFPLPDGSSFTPGEDGSFTPPEGGFRGSSDGSSLGPSGSGAFASGAEGSSKPSREDFAEFRSAAPAEQTPIQAALSLLRAFWLPVSAACLVLALICLALWRRCRKKQQPEPEGEPDEDALPSRRKSKLWIPLLCLVLAVVFLIQQLPVPQTEEESVTVNTVLITGTAQPSVIHTTLSGAGTLSAQELETIQVPQVVEITRYHVQNGDSVSEGTILASVNTTSLACAIVQLQEVLEELDSDLKTQASKSSASTITAITGGRVKAIYAAPGQSISDTVSQKGSLMVLSLDGLMVLQVPAPENAQVGTQVLVTLPEGVSEQGSVSALWDGTATVTFSDATALPGAIASVSDLEGSVWGIGAVSVHSPWHVTDYYGTVSSVPVSVNQKVTAGSTLLYLTQTGHTEEYNRLLALRGALEEQMEALFRLSPDGYIRSTGSGLVTGVPEDAEILPLAANAGKITAKSLTSNSGGPRVTLLSNVTEQDASPEEEPEESEEPEETEEPSHLGLVATVTGITGKQLQLRYYLFPVTLSSYEELPSLAGLSMSVAGELEYTGAFLADGQEVALESIQPGDLLFFDMEGIVICAHTGTPQQPSVPEATRPSTQDKPSAAEGSASSGGSGTIPSGSSAMPSGSSRPSSSGASGNSQSSSYEAYSTAKQDVLTLVSAEYMTTQIQVDELDILCVSPGLEAQLTLDAMKGRSFTGTVTKVARTGSNSGGNTKYTVEITLPREAQMLAGMNVSATLITSSTQAEVTVPAAALVEDNGITYVYTGYQAETDTLTSLVPVQTGLSDGETVEVLSGLEPGSTYYYRYAEEITYRFTASL